MIPGVARSRNSARTIATRPGMNSHISTMTSTAAIVAVISAGN